MTAFRIFVATAAPVAGVRIKREETQIEHGGGFVVDWFSNPMPTLDRYRVTPGAYRRLSGH